MAFSRRYTWVLILLKKRAYAWVWLHQILPIQFCLGQYWFSSWWHIHVNFLASSDKLTMFTYGWNIIFSLYEKHDVIDVNFLLRYFLQIKLPCQYATQREQFFIRNTYWIEQKLGHAKMRDDLVGWLQQESILFSESQPTIRYSEVTNPNCSFWSWCL
jgi:hypothetical protein